MKKLAWIVVMALLVLGCDALSDSADRELAHALRHAEEIANIQVQMMLVSRASREFVVGNIDAVDELKEARTALNQSFRILRHGDGRDDGRGDGDAKLLPLPESMLTQLDAMEQTWTELERSLQGMQERAGFVVDYTEKVHEFASLVPRLQMRLDQVVQQMLDTSGASPDQIYLATRQLVLADRMLRRIPDMMAGGIGAVTAADHLARDAQLIGKVLDGMKYGDEGLGISRIESEATGASLNDAMDQFSATRDALDAVLDGFNMLQELKIAADEVFLDSYYLVEQSRELMNENSRRSQY